MEAPAMKKLFVLALFLLIAAAIIAVGVLIGSNASWYFAWIVGTALFVLLLAGSVVWFDKQDETTAKPPQRPD
ncbi:hypothetical protein [Thiomonas sp.]|uniref:hypothetical protein n=1 Tax=Thiomonas sp. TaxID=2047785 RepID=UPI0026379776|nr:hypothetical protein [Thiomonas sp.]